MIEDLQLDAGDERLRSPRRPEHAHDFIRRHLLLVTIHFETISFY
jgi:hypothetical protein